MSFSKPHIYFSHSRSKSIYGTVAKTVGEIVHTVTEHAKKITAVLTEFYDQLEAAFREKVLPALRTAVQNIESILSTVYEDTLDLALAIIERVIKALRQFEPDFAKFGKKIATFVKQYTDLIDKYFEWARNEYNEISKLLAESAKELPGLEFLREKYQEVCKRIVFLWKRTRS